MATKGQVKLSKEETTDWTCDESGSAGHDNLEKGVAPALCGSSSERWEPKWKQIKELDRHRLKILKKVELPFLRVLMSWNGTCWSGVLTDAMVWIPIIIYSLIRTQAHYNANTIPENLVEVLGDGNISVLGGFLSFFLILFVNQTNTRFFDMYQLSRACSGRVQDIAGYAAAKLPPAQAHRVVRYMNAAHLAGYTGLGEHYTKENFFEHFNGLYGLLQPNELKMFDGIDMDTTSDAFKELCTWCQKEVASAQNAGILDDIAANEMHTRILALRAAMDGIYDTIFQPPHFYYIHFLCILTAIYLPISAIDSACSVGFEDFHWSAEILYGATVVVQSIFVVGLRLLGQKMIDPYGDDYEDISVITIVTTCIEITRICLNSSDQGPADLKLERTLSSHHNQLSKDKIF